MVDDEAYDELFTASVEDFVPRRDALVKQLKAEGDKEQAAVVKAWRRPSRVVGALNRLALTDADAAGDFAEAARAMAESRVSELREANERFRAAVKQAAAAAVDALDEARASDLGEITSGLLTIGADADALDTFTEGRLLELPDAGQGGFGFGLGLDLGSEPSPSTSKAKEKPKRATTKKQSAAEQEDELAERRRRAERVRRQAAADEAAGALRDAEEAVEAATERVDDARQVRDEAEAALGAAQDELDAATAAAAEAKEALEEAEAALDE